MAMMFFTSVKAQAPQLMSFQSVIRDNTGKLVTNHSVGLRLSIVQGTVNGTAVYSETQTVISNANGLVILQIGGGSVVSGTFSAIDWSAGPYYIKSEIDPTGGTSYGIAGTTQLLSVAYALYASKSGSPSGTSITNTKVIGDSLFITLSTGQIITAGYVRGETGLTGANGNTVLNGKIDPIVSLGNLGDFYLNTSTNCIYGPKTNGGWGKSTSLISTSGNNNIQTLIFTSNGF